MPKRQSRRKRAGDDGGSGDGDGGIKRTEDTSSKPRVEIKEPTEQATIDKLRKELNDKEELISQLMERLAENDRNVNETTVSLTEENLKRIVSQIQESGKTKFLNQVQSLIDYKEELEKQNTILYVVTGLACCIAVISYNIGMNAFRKLYN